MNEVYTKEQLINIRNNLSLISINALDVLKIIQDEPKITNKDLIYKSNLGKSVVDKCIAAYLASGLVNRIDDGIKRMYVLTKDGENILSLS
ncbi:hypothetical protein [Clostridium tyrobutyricum]|jgi:predicted transcriptional regulator|uniref:hypothetical protein n=1 Tax=Clostridium tyrobutyricum TaxID=1519 RepID=UPI000E96B7C4|nr:hypothetical protein [Clostridium tyrobutyricum]HBF76726.1 hypothetical protein [Clostridiaceae bacterium]